MAKVSAHVERPARLADGKTYCACGQPWPCPRGSEAAPAASALAGILHGHRQHVSANFPAPGICVSRCADSQPRWPCGAYRAAAAAKAALKLADDWTQEFARLEPSGADAVSNAGPGSYLVSGRLGALEDCAKALREAITAALAGKKTGDER